MSQTTPNGEHCVWSESSRHRIWLILARMRTPLSLEVDPHIVSAFTYIHKFLQGKTSSPYSPTILIVTAVLAACKATETPRTMQRIFSVFLQSCKYLQENIYRSSKFCTYIQVGNFNDRQITEEETKQVNRCEIDLLSAINFNLDLKLPFSHLKDNIEPYIKSFDVKIQSSLLLTIKQSICISLLSDIGSQMDPSIIAAAAVFHGFNDNPNPDVTMPPEIQSWVQTLMLRAGEIWPQAIKETSIPKKST